MSIKECLSYCCPCFFSTPAPEQEAVIPEAQATVPAAPPKAPKASVLSATTAQLDALDDISDQLGVTLAEIAGTTSQPAPSTASFYAARRLTVVETRAEEEQVQPEELELPGFSDPEYVLPQLLESKLSARMIRDERKEQPKAAGAGGAGAMSVSPLATITDKPLSILAALASQAAQSRQ